MDSMAFKSVEDGRISASGTSTIEVEALNTGIVGNVPAGSIETLSGMIVGLSSVRQPLAATGGADSESDKALYKRIDASRKKPQTSGNVYDYEKWSLSVSGVGAVKVFPLWDGAGTVKVLIVSEDKKPVDIDTILRCHSHIEENRPIGATVTVATPSTVLVNVSAKIICSNDVETTALMFSKKLGEYIGGIAFLESEILLSRVGAAHLAMNMSAKWRPYTLPVVASFEVKTVTFALRSAFASDNISILNGSWFLDGSRTLSAVPWRGGRIPKVEFKLALPVKYLGECETVAVSRFALDGTYMLDGSRRLNGGERVI